MSNSKNTNNSNSNQETVMNKVKNVVTGAWDKTRNLSDDGVQATKKVARRTDAAVVGAYVGAKNGWTLSVAADQAIADFAS